MSDLFGDWVPPLWISKVISMAGRNPQHIFQFLTKNPKRLSNFPWPRNCWVGTTVTNQADADERLPWLLQVDAPVRFVSHEPLLGPTEVKTFLPLPDHHGDALLRGVQWAIIGAQTGPGAVKVEPAWVAHLEYQYQAAGVPVFEKDNLAPLLDKGATLIREWPK